MRNWLFAWLTIWTILSVRLTQGQTSYKFVPITPCRAVCTFCDRGIVGPLSGPALVANKTREFPLISSKCKIPETAVAYSLNVTVVPKESSLWFVTIWPSGTDTPPDTSTLNAPQGQPVANAAIVPAGLNGAVNVFATNATDLILDLNGYFVPDGASNTGTSSAAFFNTGFGDKTLQQNTGNNNTAIGNEALSSSNQGPNNIAVGFRALANNQTGGANTALGSMSLWGNVSGTDNVAVGFNALYNNSLGSDNIALGTSALANVSLGSNNIAIGSSAGTQVTTGTNNIHIGNTGAAGDSNVIRIGTSAFHKTTYIAGISKNNLSGGSVVFVDANGQLGTVYSSRRYKTDIHDMGKASEGLWRLRPVTFRYKSEAGGNRKLLQYGLIAEEVEAIYPELVIRDRDGQIQSVQYHQLPVMLLNELQKQHQTIQEQAQNLRSQREEIQALERRISQLEKVLHQGGSPH